MFCRVYGKSLYTRDIEYWYQDKLIENEEKFFSIKPPKLPKEIVYCGDVSYRKVTYKVYWNSLTHEIAANKTNSIYYFSYPGVESVDAANAREKLMATFQRVFPGNTREF
jgi:hypothetical protein